MIPAFSASNALAAASFSFLTTPNSVQSLSTSASDVRCFSTAVATSERSLSFSPFTISNSPFFAAASASNSPLLATAALSSASKDITLASISAFLAPNTFNSSTFAFTFSSISIWYACAVFLSSPKLLSTAVFWSDTIRISSFVTSNCFASSSFSPNSSELFLSNCATMASNFETLCDTDATSASFARRSFRTWPFSSATASRRALASSLAAASDAPLDSADRRETSTAARRARSEETSSAAARRGAASAACATARSAAASAASSAESSSRRLVSAATCPRRSAASFRRMELRALSFSAFWSPPRFSTSIASAWNPLPLTTTPSAAA
ncbi:hypothetical protein EE612_059916 [Oryza sativa]|nr:hypothetical protein EE612_059916 [Oryza sativa]